MPQTLDDMQRRCLLRAEMPLDTQRYEDGELLNYVNQSLGELYDLLVSSYGVDNFLDAYEFATVAGQTRYNLPVNFYKSAGLDLKAPDNKYYTLSQFNHADRNLYLNAPDFFVDGVPRHRYRIRNMHLDILPAPEAAHNCTLHFIPQVTRLVSSSDVISNSIVESWLEYVEVDVAAKLLEKDEDLERAAGLKQTKQLLIQRIQLSTNRDLETPEVVSDDGNTLFNLRVQARYAAGMLGKGAVIGKDMVSDRELTHYINNALGDLNDLLVTAYDQHYMMDAYEFNTVSGVSDYDLPEDFYKLGWVDITDSGHTYNMLPLDNFGDRNMYVNAELIPYRNGMRFDIINHSLRFFPAPESAKAITLWYTKTIAPLVNDTDVVDNSIVSNWLGFVTDSAALDMLNKAILSAQPTAIQQIQVAIGNLMAKKMGAEQKIKELAMNRIWSSPKKRRVVRGY
jgi:hypothetical protein